MIFIFFFVVDFLVLPVHELQMMLEAWNFLSWYCRLKHLPSSYEEKRENIQHLFSVSFGLYNTALLLSWINKMINLLRKVFVVLILLIDWKKLLFMSSILSVGSIFVQTSRLPYPLYKWVFSSSTVVTYQNAISEDFPITLIKRLGVIQVDPAVRGSPNSSARPNHSTLGTEGENLSNMKRQRKKRSQRKHGKPVDIIISSPSPHYVNMSRDLLVSVY